MTDYSNMIDAETWAFIERTNSFYPPETASYPIVEQRNIYNKMCKAFMAPRPESVTSKDIDIMGTSSCLTIRQYDKSNCKAQSIILYFHGGGFVVGDLDSHDDVCAEICARTGHRVIALDYRLAPVYLHPAPYEDALSLFNWVIAQTDMPIQLCGDSAGGTIAAMLAQQTKTHPRAAKKQVLIYPWLAPPREKGSYITHKNAPMLTTDDMGFYHKIRFGNSDKSPEAEVYPLADRPLDGLPETFIITAECDPLADDGPLYHTAIINAGGTSRYIQETGLVHGFLRARHSSKRASISFGRCIEYLT